MGFKTIKSSNDLDDLRVPWLRKPPWPVLVGFDPSQNQGAEVSSFKGIHWSKHHRPVDFLMFLGKHPVGKTSFQKSVCLRNCSYSEIFETGSRVISGTFLRFFSGCVMVSVPVFLPVYLCPKSGSWSQGQQLWSQRPAFDSEITVERDAGGKPITLVPHPLESSDHQAMSPVSGILQEAPQHLEWLHARSLNFLGIGCSSLEWCGVWMSMTSLVKMAWIPFWSMGSNQVEQPGRPFYALVYPVHGEISMSRLSNLQKRCPHKMVLALDNVQPLGFLKFCHKSCHLSPHKKRYTLW